MEQRKTIKTIDSIPFALGFQRENAFYLSGMIENHWRNASVESRLRVWCCGMERKSIFIFIENKEKKLQHIKKERRKNFSTFLALSAFNCNWFLFSCFECFECSLRFWQGIFFSGKSSQDTLWKKTGANFSKNAKLIIRNDVEIRCFFRSISFPQKKSFY